jgi:integrase
VARCATSLQEPSWPASVTTGAFGRRHKRDVPPSPRSPERARDLETKRRERRVQSIFVHWQRVAEFEAIYNFHTLRHTAITNVYRATKDLFLTQRFARHANPITTVAYTHPSDEELYSAIRGIGA